MSRYTEFVPALAYKDAREAVLSEVPLAVPTIELVTLAAAPNRILAENIVADRDYPPFHRSARDGFAVRAADLPGTLRITAEIRAGQHSSARLGHNEAIEIMTGAPVPDGADSVVMVEHTNRLPNEEVRIEVTLASGANVVRQGSEAQANAVILHRGIRVDHTHIAALASVGRTTIPVYQRPTVAILSTGDELLDIAQSPAPHQIRNSNAHALAAQVERSGGNPKILPIARDTREDTKARIEEGLTSDLLLLSGGVSAGKYDVVEPVLAELGAEFFFDRVLIQPGQPLVFGRIRNKFFFGLPGNPASTMMTFELFARPALQRLAGMTDAPEPLTLARLTTPFRHRPGLTRFLPAIVRGSEVTPVANQGSGDIQSLCRANAYLVADPDTDEYGAGDLIHVLLK